MNTRMEVLEIGELRGKVCRHLRRHVQKDDLSEVLRGGQAWSEVVMAWEDLEHTDGTAGKREVACQHL